MRFPIPRRFRSPILRILAIGALCMATPDVAAYTVIDGKIPSSKIYPETVHTFKVTVPEGYKGQPACLYIGMDGILCSAPERIDSLIATGDIPVMAGIFLQPGAVYSEDGQSVVRWNRSNEFDATDGRFARFLETEVIPAAKAAAAEAGVTLNILPGGDNTMVFGLSSGGIAAFTAAWHRPDLFGRVYTGCGTFVPMRGGDGLAAIVRKNEPQPLRLFIQDGFTDSWNPLFGSWFEANQLLASALKFAGYDVNVDWAEGGHSVRRTSQIFPEVMKWMWRDYPDTLAVQNSGNATLMPWLEDAGEWQTRHGCPDAVADTVAVYPDSTRCAVTADASNYLTQYLLRKDGSRYAGQRYYWLHNYNNATVRKGGMAFDGNGYLWVLTDAGVQVCDQNGRVRGIFNLPVALDIALTDDPQLPLSDFRLEIADNELRLVSPKVTYTRRLHITPAVPGVTPKSEGPA